MRCTQKSRYIWYVRRAAAVQGELTFKCVRVRLWVLSASGARSATHRRTVTASKGAAVARGPPPPSIRSASVSSQTQFSNTQTPCIGFTCANMRVRQRRHNKSSKCKYTLRHARQLCQPAGQTLYYFMPGRRRCRCPSLPCDDVRRDDLSSRNRACRRSHARTYVAVARSRGRGHRMARQEEFECRISESVYAASSRLASRCGVSRVHRVHNSSERNCKSS